VRMYDALAWWNFDMGALLCQRFVDEVLPWQCQGDGECPGHPLPTKGYLGSAEATRK